MKIFTTGSSGFIGTHLVELLKKKHEVAGYDLKEGDNVLDEEKLEERMRGFDILVHLAAIVQVDQSWTHPSLFYENNVVGTSKVMEVAKKVGIKRIIFASSCAAYFPFSSPYAATKAMGELILEVNKDIIPSVAFRFFNVYGRGQNPVYGAAIPEFVKGAKKGKITIYGDGKQTRDFVHVRDICGAIEKTIEIHEKLPKYVRCDIGTGDSIAINNLAQVVIQASRKHNVQVEHKPARKEVRFVMSNPTLLEELFEYKCKTELFDGIEELISNGIH